MRPPELRAENFALYPPLARAFAVEHLALLQRLPLAVCPSFLLQVAGLDTSFPVERATLERQCAALEHVPAATYAQLTAPLNTLTLSASLLSINWVAEPAAFISELTAYLWSSGQLDRFRAGTEDLFAAIPPFQDDSNRLAVVVLGRGASVDGSRVLAKLRTRGVLLNQLTGETAWAEIAHAVRASAARKAPYATWYVDGGEPHPELAQAALDANGVAMTYGSVAPIRQRVLARMERSMQQGGSGAEQMRTHLMSTSASDVDASDVTRDPVLARFYTQLFTESSGPQIFSTSFVQWAGRELARRAQPCTLLLRYAPRQRYRDLNELFATEGTQLDPQGSLRDAEMGAYYHWLEMDRISGKGRLTFVAWVEETRLAVVVSAHAPAGSVCSTPMAFAQALETFG